MSYYQICTARIKASRLSFISTFCITLLGLAAQGQVKQPFGLDSQKGFVENKGQVKNQDYKINESVAYIWASGNGMNVQLRADGFGFDTYQRVKNQSGKYEFQAHRLDMHLMGANPGAEIIAKKPFHSHTNYYPNQDQPEETIMAVSFGEVLYKNIYENIDLSVGMTPDQKQMKYDFIVHPGADVSQIKLEYRGFTSFELNEGAMEFDLSGKKLLEYIPQSWTLPEKKSIQVDYAIEYVDENAIQVCFVPKDYQSELNRTLIIDPLVTLQWSTYYGDTLYDVGNAIATDSLGNIFVAGTTESMHSMASEGSYQSTFSGGLYDAFLVKFNQHGLRHWSTYYGGSGDDEALGVAVDAYEKVYIVGTTSSGDSIGSEGAYLDSLIGSKAAFLAKFDRYGALEWDTYIGGMGEEAATAVAVTNTNKIYVGGVTTDSALFDSSGVDISLPFEGGTDGFLANFDGDGTLLWASFLGGDSIDLIQAIALDPIGQLCISGTTLSASGLASENAFQPAISGSKDAFAALFTGTGNRVWSSYYGGDGDDSGTGIAASSGQIYLTGTTNQSNSMVSDSAHQAEFGGEEDAYLAALDSSGAIIWYTYFGGDSTDQATGISLDYDQNVYIVGNTKSTQNIANSDSIGAQYFAGADAFVAKFSPNGLREWGTYFGGSGDEDARAIAAYGFTAVFFTGRTESVEDMAYAFGIEDSSHQETYGGGSADGFVARLTQMKSTSPVGVCGGDCPWGGGSGSTEPAQVGVCIGNSIELSVSGGALGIGAQWVWYRDTCGVTDLFIGEGSSITVSPTVPTTYYVRWEHVDNQGSCTPVFVNVDFPPVAEAFIPDSLCPGSSTNLHAEGGMFYSWTGPNDFISEVQSPLLDSLGAVNEGAYTVTVSTLYGCTDNASVNLELLPGPIYEIGANNISCPGFNDGSIAVTGPDLADLAIEWSIVGASGFSADSLSPGLYTISLTNTYNCMAISEVTLTEPMVPIDSVQSLPAYCDQANGSVEVFLSGNSGPYTVFWMPGELFENAPDSLHPGTYIVSVIDTNGCLYGDSLVVENLGNFMAVIEEDSVYLDFTESIELLAYANPAQVEEIYLWAPPSGLSCADCADPLANPVYSTTYQVTITSDLGCSSTDSVFVHRAIPPSQAFLPTIFSPNQDGLNDELCALGDRIVSMKLMVYNRWGELVFQSGAQSECWDGLYNGSPVQTGAYAYFFEATLDDGEQIQESGNLKLVR